MEVLAMKLHYGFDEISQLDWASILPILLPFLLVGSILILIALIDLYRHRNRRENVLMWTIIIVFFNTIGPVLYFMIGRKDVNTRALRN
ncbi:hypothetical protein BB14905_02155 [Bacillus sp. B14905]|nr:hypothetical protein BB14905_02155 [Bacillus sp. B14905]